MVKITEKPNDATKPGETIVVEGQLNLFQGAKVKIK